MDRREDLGFNAAQRAPDPRIAAQISAALGNATTVINVDAGTGSYEPRDRAVVAVEPSMTMIRRRPPGSAPVIKVYPKDSRSWRRTSPRATGTDDSDQRTLAGTWIPAIGSSSPRSNESPDKRVQAARARAIWYGQSMLLVVDKVPLGVT